MKKRDRSKPVSLGVMANLLGGVGFRPSGRSEPLFKPKPYYGRMVRECPGGRHAYYESSVVPWPVRKEVL